MSALAEVAALESAGKTVAAVFRTGHPLVLIAMRDEARGDAAAARVQMAAMGVGATMLTGDGPRTAAAIPDGLGPDFRASMMPEDTLTAIRAANPDGRVMIGDGINDAPDLKEAHAGIAMGSGTDVALETTDGVTA